jgi:hypothetical protein
MDISCPIRRTGFLLSRRKGPPILCITLIPSNSPPQNIVTETWLYDPELCQEMMAFIQLVDEFCEAHQIQIPPTSELVLELRQDSETGENYCAYYFARPETRTIFWWEEFVLDLDEVKGGQLPPQHVGTALSVSNCCMCSSQFRAVPTKPVLVSSLRIHRYIRPD